MTLGFSRTFKDILGPLTLPSTLLSTLDMTLDPRPSTFVYTRG